MATDTASLRRHDYWTPRVNLRTPEDIARVLTMLGAAS